MLGSDKWRDKDDADAEEEGQGDTRDIEELVEAVDPLRARMPFERNWEGRVENVAFEGPADFFGATSVLTRRRIGTIIKKV